MSQSDPIIPSTLTAGNGKALRSIPALTAQDASRFWQRVNKDGPTPIHVQGIGNCWLFGKGRPNTYGGFTIGCETFPAHRISYVLANGSIPRGLWVLHKCDNPQCIRPDHLFAGTHLENAQDMAAKGRAGGQQPEGDARTREIWQWLIDVRDGKRDATDMLEWQRR